MSTSRALRAASSQNLCLFCSCSLRDGAATPSFRRSLRVQRRRLNTSRRSPQSAGVAAAHQQDDNPPPQPQRPPIPNAPPNGGAWGRPVFTAKVTLTDEEIRQRDALRTRAEEARRRDEAARAAAQETEVRRQPKKSTTVSSHLERPSSTSHPSDVDARVSEDLFGPSGSFRFRRPRESKVRRTPSTQPPPNTHAQTSKRLFAQSNLRSLVLDSNQSAASTRPATPTRTPPPSEAITRSNVGNAGAIAQRPGTNFGVPSEWLNRMPRPEQALFALSDNLLAAKREQVNQSSKPASSQGSVPASSGFKDSNTQTNAFNPTGPTWGSLPPTRAPSFTKPLERAPADRIVTEQEGKDDTYRPTFGTGSSRYSRSLQYPLSSHRETSRGEGERPRFEIRMNEERQRVSDQQDESFNPDLTSNWSHLRRRNQRDSGPPASDASPVQYNPVFDEYSRQREQRQQEARNRAFVGFSKDEQTKAWNDVTRVPSGGLSIRRLPLGKDPMFEPAQRGEHTPTTMAEGSVEPKQPRWAQSANQIESSESASGGRSTSKSATGAGFSELSTLEEKPRGRDRDKLRRREQFIVAYENNNEDLDKHRSKEDRKKQRKLEKAQRQQAKAEAPTPIYLPEFISVSNLATALRVRIEDFVHKMEELGFEAVNYDHVLNAENAGLIAMEYNYEPIVDEAAEESQDLKARPAAEDQSSLPQRPPVVTIMGHVDHGKTTILDYLRKSSVAATEHGGITQHIGAFSVSMASGKVITFLDTPGHAAFLSMRQRGATVTDMVILVVAADDSVKPQTLEAIKHAKAAQVPIIVAVNKIDKPEADVEKVKQDLARHGVEIEDFGGDTQVVGVSGKTGQGIDKLEEEIVTLSEVLDHRAETDGAVEGWVLEATTKKAGRVATVLVRRGTLQPGNIIVAGRTWARVRSLRNEAGVQVEAAGPGTPVEVDGWKDQPVAGDEVLQAPNEQKASSVVEYREELEGRVKMAVDMEAINEARRLEQEKREREEALAAAAKQAALDGSSSATADPTTAVTAPPAETTPTGPQEVFFVVKADVSGSVEAVVDYVSQVGNTEVRPHILRSGVGAISEFDIEHAAVARGHVISFNTAVDASIAQMAERRGVSILDQNIIYRLVDDVKAKLSEKLPPAVTQRVVGEAEVAQAFSINVSGRKMAKIAGCRVRNGVVGKSARVRVLRNKEVVYDGTLSSLKNVKKDVTEMRKGTECGVGFENWESFEVGDQIQCYEEKSEKRSL